VKFDWNDRRFLAAMLENCTTARAAPAIGVDQTTVARRIAALEAPSKIDLFERDHAGYRPTSSGPIASHFPQHDFVSFSFCSCHLSLTVRL
jgi:DNA-binding transcriptional LysR family regulator